MGGVKGEGMTREVVVVVVVEGVEEAMTVNYHN